MTHTCVSKKAIIDSDNGFSPDRSRAIIWTNAVIFLMDETDNNTDGDDNDEYSDCFLDV